MLIQIDNPNCKVKDLNFNNVFRLIAHFQLSVFNYQFFRSHPISRLVIMFFGQLYYFITSAGLLQRFFGISLYFFFAAI